MVNRGRAATSAIMQDSAGKKEIAALALHYLRRRVSGCKNCYFDALVELCMLKNEKDMNSNDKFVLIRGKVLKDTVNHDSRLTLVRGNETEELALYHLHTNPDARRYFERLPDGYRLDEQLATYAKRYEAEHGGGAGNDEAAAVAVSDAQAEAERILADARAEAARIVAEAKAATAEVAETASEEAETPPALRRVAKPKNGSAADPILD